jgi:hypothetical protein
MVGVPQSAATSAKQRDSKVDRGSGRYHYYALSDRPVFKPLFSLHNLRSLRAQYTPRGRPPLCQRCVNPNISRRRVISAVQKTGRSVIPHDANNAWLPIYTAAIFLRTPADVAHFPGLGQMKQALLQVSRC